MPGSTTFEMDVLNIQSGQDLSRLVIVRAHIRRALDGLKSYCPSISALVATKDSTAFQSPRPVTVQLNTNTYDRYEKTNKIMTSTISGIYSLESMMTERSDAWFDPEKLFSYRGSIDFDNYIWCKCGGIKTACRQRWPEGPEVKSTHVLCNVNSQFTFVPKSELPPNQLEKQTEPSGQRCPGLTLE
jgi:hypothetical protein